MGDVVEKLDCYCQFPTSEDWWVNYIHKDFHLAFTYGQAMGRGRDGFKTYSMTDSIVRSYAAYFRKNRKHRLRIVPDTYHLFESPDTTLPLPPTLWLAVERYGNEIVIAAIWRGNIPYAQPPRNYDETFEIVKTCCEEGGVDVPLLKEWRQRAYHAAFAAQRFRSKHYV